MKSPNLSAKGFSLIELMIVVVIIGILAAVAVPAYFNHILRSRQADAYHNLLDMKAAQEMYHSMYNRYAGPYSPLLVANTYSNLLSFTYADTEYYRYAVTTGSSLAFTAVAEGKVSKLIGNSIRITNNTDPCISSPGSLEQSLGLDDCP